MFKRLLQILLVVLYLLPHSSIAQTNALHIYIFWGDGCPHCTKAKTYLYSVEKKYPQIRLVDFEVYKNKHNQELFTEVGKILQKDITGVPFIVIGNEVFSGFSESISPQKIEQRISFCLQNSCPDSVENLASKEGISEKDRSIAEVVEKDLLPEKVLIPFFGEVNTENVSLPVFTVIMGVLDGFNPCAMWILLFLISMLLGMKDKKKMWILGVTFIVTSAFVYFLFMVAWLKLILFIGMILWIRIVIGLLALIGGSHNIQSFFNKNQSGCEVVKGETRKNIFEKIKNITHQQRFLFAFIGIILLAFAVNLVELICSAGLPAVYTQVLALHKLPTVQYYFYILLYIFFFMLDDLFVFIVSMITLQMTGITTKYTRVAHLIGGVIMVFIGILLIFKYEWLMLG